MCKVSLHDAKDKLKTGIKSGYRKSLRYFEII
jgi:hypothetical protein